MMSILFLFYIFLKVLPLVLVVMILLSIGFYCIKIALSSIQKFNENKYLKQRYRSYHNPTQSLTEIEQLPTDESLQDLIAHDGEIPDNAFHSQSN